MYEGAVLRPGDRVDRYTLVKPLGEGGQGAVWKAIDPLDGGVVRAIKLIRLGGMSAAASERARREAKAVAGAKHPALIPCRMLFEDPGQELIGLVFDFVRGQTLANAAGDPRMSREHRLAVLEQIAGSLAHVHALGIVHRDLKLENVLVTESFWSAPRAAGGVKLLDFGIATPAGNPRPLTATGLVIGTPPYMPPEQLAPGTWKPLPDGFSRDLFAFGVLAWELLAGGHPTGLPGDAGLDAYADVYRSAEAGRIVWPPRAIDGTWAHAIRACLALHPDRRPRTGAELLRLLGGGRSAVPESSAPSGRAGDRTAPHQVATEPLTRPPVSARRPSTTTPMPAPPVSAPRASRTTPMPRDAAPEPRRGMLGRVLALGALAALCGGAVVLLGDDGLRRRIFPDDDSPDPSPIPLPVASATPVASDPPAASAPTSPRSAPGSSATCCGGVECADARKDVTESMCEKREDRCAQCESGRTFVPGACRERLDRNDDWLLRLAHVTVPVSPTARVCVRRAGVPKSKWQCTAVKDASDSSDAGPAKAMGSRLGIETRDLLRGRGLDLEILDGSTPVVPRETVSVDNELKTSALCMGVKLGVRGGSVSFYLDDP